MWEYLRRLERVNDTAVAKFIDLIEEDPRKSAHKFERHTLGPRSRFGVRTCSNQVERLHHELDAAVSGRMSLFCRLASVCRSPEKRFANASKLDATKEAEKFRGVRRFGRQETARTCASGEIFCMIRGIRLSLQAQNVPGNR
jgi:hypothetical protein